MSPGDCEFARGNKRKREGRLGASGCSTKPGMLSRSGKRPYAIGVLLCLLFTSIPVGREFGLGKQILVEQVIPQPNTGTHLHLDQLRMDLDMSPACWSPQC